MPQHDRRPVRRSRFDDDAPHRRGRRRFDDEDQEPPERRHSFDTPAPDGPATGDRWSTWEVAQHGPQPHPDWLVTELAAVDTELGILKTGKEADVHLLHRGVPGASRSCLLAAKRYRSAEHRMFHRDAAYTEGRRVRRSRETRAMARRTSFGRELLAGQWARAEFDALSMLWTAGAAVPYPVQIIGTELLVEFLGDPSGTAAPRLAEISDRGADLDPLWEQLVEAMVLLARCGYAHGDLSAYNLLVHDGRLVMIDLPQAVDVVTNPNGPAFLDRDARTVAGWFTAHGRPCDPDELVDLLRSEARLV